MKIFKKLLAVFLVGIMVTGNIPADIGTMRTVFADDNIKYLSGEVFLSDITDGAATLFILQLTGETTLHIDTSASVGAIELHQYTLTVKGNDSDVLTVQDSLWINGDNSESGSIVLESGKIQVNGLPYAYHFGGSGSGLEAYDLTIKGGELVFSPSEYNYFGQSCFIRNSLTITDGLLRVETKGTYAIGVWSGAFESKLIMTGGELDVNTKGKGEYDSYGIRMDKIEISGGSVNVSATTDSADGYAIQADSLSVSGDAYVTASSSASDASRAVSVSNLSLGGTVKITTPIAGTYQETEGSVADADGNAAKRVVLAPAYAVRVLFYDQITDTSSSEMNEAGTVFEGTNLSATISEQKLFEAYVAAGDAFVLDYAGNLPDGWTFLGWTKDNPQGEFLQGGERSLSRESGAKDVIYYAVFSSFTQQYPIDLSDENNGAKVSGIVDKTYTGSAQTQKITLSAKENRQTVTLREGVDYTLSYKNNTAAGTATVIIMGIGDFAGSIEQTFKINTVSISQATISNIQDRRYTGKAQAQAPLVKWGDVVLQNRKDYTLSYKNNVRTGTATIIISGKGSFTGSVNRNFKIVGDSSWKRLSGEAGTGALGTMEKISKEYGNAKTAIVVTNAHFKDALAAAALAGSYNAPILTTAKGELSAQTASELKRMKISKILIVGNTGDVSANAEKQMKKIVHDTTRITGSGAAGKAINAAKAIRSGRSNTVIIATQKSYKDAMSISSYSYASVTPIIYAETSLKLSEASLDYIKSAKFSKAIIVGGPLAIPTSVETQLISVGIAKTKQTRLAGKGCYGTSGAIAEWAMGGLKNGQSFGKGKTYQYTSVKFQPALKLSANKLGISRGDSWKDALCGAALCGKNRAIILLADTSNSNNTSVIKKYKRQIAFGYVFGGTQAVSKTTMDKCVRASK